MTSLLFNGLLAYLLGSISGSLLLGRLKGVDIRTQGSGNAGGTNALRTQGLYFAVLVVVIDVGKGILAAGPLAHLQLFGPPAISLPAMQAWCGLSAVVGHMFPVFFGFRGGKGAGTWLGTLMVWSWPVVGGVLLVWVGLVVLFGYVGLGTMLATAASLPLAVWLGPAGWRDPFFLYCLASSIIIILAHHSNIRNMIRGEEHRFERIRLRNWFKGPPHE